MPGNLFIAALPPKDIISQVENIHSHYEHHQDWEWYRGSRIVVPIRFFGLADEKAARHALKKLHTAAPTNAAIGPHVEILAGRLVYVPVHGLHHLAHSVISKTQDVGQTETHKYIGRIVIMKNKKHGPRCFPYIEKSFHGGFEVEKLVLMKSHMGHDHHVWYEVLDTVHLHHH
jgi:2'-5' RNA ligase